MRVFLQVIDTKTGIYQSGMINEPVQKGYEIKNAIEHFTSSNIDWISENNSDEMVFKFGKIEGTTKVVSVVSIQ